MNLVLTNDDITTLNGLIQKTPFEFAYPMFQFLKGKIQEQANEEAAKLKAAEKKAPVQIEE